MENIKFTLITGASEGIGKALAYELAKRNENLLLVALPNDKLQEVALYLRSVFPIKLFTYGLDLTNDHASNKILDWVNHNGFILKTLINNAGVGYTTPFVDLKNDFCDYIIKLNVNLTVNLSKKLIPNLSKVEGGAHILNISSLASYYPIPNKCVYSASKSFIRNFSRALRSELKPLNINVSCLCPGPVETNKNVLDTIDKVGFKGRLLMTTPEKVALRCIEKLNKNEAVFMSTFLCSLVVKSTSFLPDRWLTWGSQKVFKE